MEGLLVSAVPMDGETVGRIERKFTEQLGYPITLKAETDASLIAGFVVSIQHHRFDYSARARLIEIKRHLLND